MKWVSAEHCSKRIIKTSTCLPLEGRQDLAVSFAPAMNMHMSCTLNERRHLPSCQRVRARSGGESNDESASIKSPASTGAERL